MYCVYGYNALRVCRFDEKQVILLICPIILLFCPQVRILLSCYSFNFVHLNCSGMVCKGLQRFLLMRKLQKLERYIDGNRHEQADLLIRDVVSCENVCLCKVCYVLYVNALNKSEVYHDYLKRFFVYVKTYCGLDHPEKECMPVYMESKDVEGRIETYYRLNVRCFDREDLTIGICEIGTHLNGSSEVFLQKGLKFIRSVTQQLEDGREKRTSYVMVRLKHAEEVFAEFMTIRPDSVEVVVYEFTSKKRRVVIARS